MTIPIGRMPGPPVEADDQPTARSVCDEIERTLNGHDLLADAIWEWGAIPCEAEKHLPERTQRMLGVLRDIFDYSYAQAEGRARDLEAA